MFFGQKKTKKPCMFWIGFFIIIKCEVKLEIEATYPRDKKKKKKRVMIGRQYQI